MRKNKKPQVQYSLLRQLKELYILANQNGLYDAADYIRREFFVLEYKWGKR